MMTAPGMRCRLLVLFACGPLAVLGLVPRSVSVGAVRPQSARSAARVAARSPMVMRFGKRDVKIRSILAKKIEKAQDTSDIDAVIVSPKLKQSKVRMKRRLLMKLRRRAWQLGYDSASLEERLGDVLYPVFAPVAAAPVAAEEPEVAQEEPEPVAEAAEPETPAAEPAAPAAADISSLPIVEQVNAEVKAAMKAKEKDALAMLRNVKAALTTAAKDAGVDALDDAESVKVLRKLAKQRAEAIEMYEKAGESGAERLAAEQAELAVIERWLPQLASEETVRAWIQAIIDATDGAPNKGKIMGQLMKSHKDEIDGKMAQNIAEEMVKAAAA